MKIHLSLFFLLLLMQSLSGTLHAQYEAVDREYNYLSFNHLKNDIANENLVGSHIYEDADGFIWFATETGLCRFDGQKTRYFTYEKQGRKYKMRRKDWRQGWIISSPNPSTPTNLSLLLKISIDIKS